MKVIDSDNYASSGIKTFFFPGGEPHAQLPEDKFGDALLFLKARTWNDVGIAACVLDALHRQGSMAWLFAAYYPGARQDRTDYRTPLTKALIGEFLGQYCQRFYTFDMHSNTTTGMHVEQNFMPSDLIPPGTPKMRDAWVIAPDHGAITRAQDFASAQCIDSKIIVCDKQRDFATGQITGFKLPPLPGIGDYLVVDDICDGGWTFNSLAEEFVKDPKGPLSTLDLYVSHGIFSKGISNISHLYNNIITTDSWCRNTLDRPKRLDVVSLQPVIDRILESANEL
jgi:ribose-phosphate pyrophosphokinase